MLIKSGSELKEYYINIESSISDAMLQIEKNCKRGALVLNKNKEVVGIVTDGDIRKSLIKGVYRNTLIKDVLNSNFKFIENYPQSNLDKRLNEIFSAYNEIEILPIVDKSMKLIAVALRRS